jgi:hypothetical protein
MSELTDEQKKELNIVDENFKKIEQVIQETAETEGIEDDYEGEEDLLIEPEDCEYCKKQDEEAGIEYVQEYHVVDGVAVCDGCGRIM